MLGVQVLLAACLDARVPRVVQVSTDEVYGSVTSGRGPKTRRWQPNSPYAAAKAGGDLMARAYARTHGLNVSITRCCNNYGPYQYPEKVIPLFVTNLMEGSRFRFTAMAATFAAGYTWTTTAAASSWSSSKANLAVSTTSTATSS